MSAKVEKPTPPSAQEYAQAFYAIESQIHRVQRLARIADYLTSIVDDMAKAGKNLSDGYHAGLAGDAVAEVRAAIDEVDASYLATYNDFVGRENAAVPFTGKVPVIGEARA